MLQITRGLFLNVPRVLGQSEGQITAPTDTNENVLATITVPANTLGANGRLIVTTLWGFTNNANAKTIRVRFSGASGTQYLQTNYASAAFLRDQREIVNNNATNSQIGFGGSGTGGWGNGASANTTSSVDTTAATTLVISAQKGTDSDTITLDYYRVEYVYGA